MACGLMPSLPAAAHGTPLSPDATCRAQVAQLRQNLAFAEQRRATRLDPAYLAVAGGLTVTIGGALLQLTNDGARASLGTDLMMGAGVAAFGIGLVAAVLDSSPISASTLSDRYAQSPKLLVTENSDGQACRLIRTYAEVALSFNVTSTIMNALVQSWSGGSVADNDVTGAKSITTAPPAATGSAHQTLGLLSAR
jgi:hypothetical protein